MHTRSGGTEGEYQPMLLWTILHVYIYKLLVLTVYPALATLCTVVHEQVNMYLHTVKCSTSVHLCEV